ncbi:ATP-dependent DNA helicase [Alphaproteobacteria bacterium]|nr:ATP-dependent DNA helicase [Alphaproteobacteria bacterium]
MRCWLAAIKRAIPTGMSSYPPNFAETVPELHSAPVFYPHGKNLIWISANGEISTLDQHSLSAELALGPALLCHRRWSSAKAGFEIETALDLMELFAFVRPARFCLPTASGLAAQLSLPAPQTAEDMAATLPKVAYMLLDELAGLEQKARGEAGRIATMMAQGGWTWGPLILAHLGLAPAAQMPPDGRDAMIWQRLPEYSDYTPLNEPGSLPVIPDAARERLDHMLGGANKSGRAETRESQSDYAAAVSASFDTPDAGPRPAMVLAEAGTGTGKTLGYLAPATLWAEKNGAAVWISTYTRTLQHQIAAELTRLYPDAETREKKVVLRKGRENYLCLLNLEEALMQMPGQPRRATALGLMARWAGATSDGDLTGASFPAWLLDLLGRNMSVGLADRRGECIHAACPHYNKCFVEKSMRRARRADIVVTNHALVMIQAAYASNDDKRRPTRYVFDEGHHVFDAADSAFSAYLSSGEAAELRNWVRGAEDGRKGRARGLKKRLEEILAGDSAALEELDAALEAARDLPGQGWPKRLSAFQPMGTGETFFMHLRNALYERASDTTSPYDIQTHIHPATDMVIKAAKPFAESLARLGTPLTKLAKRLKTLLDDKAEELDTSTRSRIEGAIRGLELRATGPVASWQLMLGDIANGERDGFVDWMQIDRLDGQDRDVGMARHWLDPTIPFASEVLESAHGVAITSATLQDQAARQKALDGDMAIPDIAAPQIVPHDGWQSAITLTGASHLDHATMRASFQSPFDYANQTKILVVNDLERDRPEATAAAMAGLMKASGGGGLGLFTAIRRLKAVYPSLAARLDMADIPLYAQHIDQMNLQTLLAMFREDPASCLLGTDAVRDGIDVPGAALRLIVFDRMPWPRSDILFQARAKWQGRDAWTERLTRLKLRQAFGRLIRRADDRGVFVMLDSRLPTRLTSAFPPDVEVERIGLAEAIAKTGTFLNP